MAPRVYCTYFDHNYLSRGLALYHSLQRHAPGARLWVLCLTESCHQALTAFDLPDLVPCRLSDFEAADPKVAATRASRSTVEYYFTCSPAWMLYVADREAGAEWVTYLDSDLFFFDSPEAIYDELVSASVAIIPHRYTARIAKMQKHGIYNVGWVGARNDAEGRRVMDWWRGKCIEWCHDYVDGERFADQGYLNAFPTLSPRVRVIENVGANLAPWNIGNHRIAQIDGRLMIDEKTPLIFFHFQGLKKDLGFFVFNSHRLYRAPFSTEVRQHIYKPYVDELLSIEKALAPPAESSAAKPKRLSAHLNIRQLAANRLRKAAIRLVQLVDITTGRAFVVFRGTAR
jgi:hypothetical protein